MPQKRKNPPAGTLGQKSGVAHTAKRASQERGRKGSHPQTPAIRGKQFALGRGSRDDSWSKFQNLVDQWRAARGATSSITAMSMLPPYQRIIGMGKPAIPLILAQLKSEGDDPDHWFWALTAITGANPVRHEDQGNTVKMAESWLKWGETQGYAG